MTEPGTGADRRERFLADANAIVDAYREDGWTVLALEPGDVTPVERAEHDRFGFSVLVPDDEFEVVDALFGGGSDVEGGDSSEATERDPSEAKSAVDAVDVYRHDDGDTVFALAVERDDSSRTAVAIPLAYRHSEAPTLLETALERGELPIHVRPLSLETWVTFEHEEPSLFCSDSDPDGASDAVERRDG